MAFADPQSVTVNAVAQSLPRVGLGPSSGIFQKDDQSYKLEIFHDKKKRTRHIAKLSFRKIAADVYTASNNIEYTGSVTLTLDGPNVGYTNTDLLNIVNGFVGWLTPANVTKVIAFEV